MSPHIGEIPRSIFQFDFELERKILAEAEKETPNWSKLLESLPQRTARLISRVVCCSSDFNGLTCLCIGSDVHVLYSPS